MLPNLTYKTTLTLHIVCFSEFKKYKIRMNCHTKLILKTNITCTFKMTKVFLENKKQILNLGMPRKRPDQYMLVFGLRLSMSRRLICRVNATFNVADCMPVSHPRGIGAQQYS